MKYHVPVLLNESVNGLSIKPEGTYIDLTFGGGGHSKLILEKLNFGTSNYLSAKEQSEYKYIINIDGHSAAYRLSYELSQG